MSQQRKRRVPSGFEWHHDEANHLVRPTDGPPPTVRIKHTDLNLDIAGASSSHTTYITAPASPEKRRDQCGPTSPNFNWLDGEFLPEMLGEQEQGHGAEEEDEEDAVDPDYQHHIDTIEPGPP